ncbi:MAG: 3-oxoacyl-ACP reductase FabG [Bryobacterales bacterium]|nr:3-oxoacyl-ACP reductase FabG [Bryobacterales bacterium]
MNSVRFKGRVALVTGGSRGIGRAVAELLSQEGASVAVNYRARAEEAATVVEAIRNQGRKAVAVKADVASRSEVDAMVDQTCSTLGPIDILVNNAGLLATGNLLHYEPDEFERMWRVNVSGVLHATASVAPFMIERKYGRIVNLSSIAALGTAVPGTTLYAATKGAVQILTKRFALELGPHGITVNAVLPGLILTDMVSEGHTEEEMQRRIEVVSRNSLLGRVGEPGDIASVVAFLASDESGFMTGQFLTADGGRTDFLTHA